ncbi:hypothetical protein C7M84_007484 [Penaeus vannamei]|uniref:Uncharacterized protein n=1 Tax=Penaeus vannamei TaxID=6689 RepID=A0A3R7P302_PENVA|nr:hypothetical protein C7M84_007484 [Penaeus vannamei]
MSPVHSLSHPVTCLSTLLSSPIQYSLNLFLFRSLTHSVYSAPLSGQLIHSPSHSSTHSPFNYLSHLLDRHLHAHSTPRSVSTNATEIPALATLRRLKGSIIVVRISRRLFLINSFLLRQCRAVRVGAWEDSLYDETTSAADVITTIAASLRDVTLGSGDLLTLGNLLGHLREKHENDLLSTSVQSEALDLAKRYLKGSLEVTDALLTYPGLWWGLLQENRVLTSSLLQDSLCHGAVMLATYQESSITDFSLNSLPGSEYAIGLASLNPEIVLQGRKGDNQE